MIEHNGHSKLGLENKVVSKDLQKALNPKTPFNLSNATPEKYRFLYIDDLLAPQAKITICESKDNSLSHAYACVSYVWRDLASIEGADTVYVSHLDELDNNTSLAVLQTVCRAAKQLGNDWLWMDKFCIRQDKDDNKRDNVWQVQHMTEIYAGCSVCLVAPGGMTKLPDVGQRTSWIDRAWTLQESIAPKNVQILIRWLYEPKSIRQGNRTFAVTPVEGEESVVMTSLVRMLECNSTWDGDIWVVPTDKEPKIDRAKADARVGIFAEKGESTFAITALLDAISLTRGENKVLDNYDGENEGKLLAIWRTLMLRSARYKRDLILASMGIMGVKVDIGRISNDGNKMDWNDDEITQLLIRCVQKLADAGARAEWFGQAPALGPSNPHSCLPLLPLDYNKGLAFEKGKEEWDIKPRISATSAQDYWWWLKGSPKVRICDFGSVSFKTKAHSVIDIGMDMYTLEEKLMKEKEERETKEQKGIKKPRDNKKLKEDKKINGANQPKDGEQRDFPLMAHPDWLINCSTDKVWTVDAGSESDRGPYAVYVGTKEQLRDGAGGAIFDPFNALFMLVAKIDTDRYKNIGYVWGAPGIAESWEEKDFTVL